MDQMEKQAARFGAEILSVHVTRVDLSSRPFGVWAGDQEWRARTLVIATGATAKWLGVPARSSSGGGACRRAPPATGSSSEIVSWSSWAAGTPRWRTFLTRFASKVTIVHRRDEFRASKIMQDRALANPKIEVIWNAAVEEVQGDDGVTGVRLRTRPRTRCGSSPRTGCSSRSAIRPTRSCSGLVGPGPGRVHRGGRAADPDLDRGRVRGRRRHRSGLSSGGDRRRAGMQGAMDAERMLEAEGHTEE